MNESNDNGHEVALVSPSGTRLHGIFTMDRSDDNCTLTLRYQGKQITASGTDYFEALCTIRKQLELEGLTPLCYGTSRRCFPSGMARDMGAGLKVYKLQLGRKSRMADLMETFRSGPDVEPASVAEQRAFFDQWLNQ